MMNPIGGQSEAAEALRIVCNMRDPWRDEPQGPGWSRAGQGTTRTVLLAPSGVVYKVPCPLRPNWEDGIRHNRLEADRFAKWAGRDFMARWHLHEVPDANGDLVPVMAMEYVEDDGTEPTNLEEVWAALRDVGAEDRHRDNYRVRGRRAIIIDAGGPASDGTPSYFPPHRVGPGRAAGLW
jgi:hypothetical protein